jgi:ABC-type transport system involved in multi-copper enzyme maturation permease subunit
MPLPPDFSTGLRLALRARFLSLTLWLTLALIAVVWMAAQFRGRQPATVALDVGLSVLRLALPVIGLLLLQELLSREFDRRLFLTSLTYPRPRYHFLLGRLAAIHALLFLLLIGLAGILAALVHFIGQDYEQTTPVALGLPYAITIAFMAVDLFVILALGALLAVVAATPSFVLIGALGFMLVARSFSSIVALLHRDAWLVEDLVGNPEQYRASLNLLSYLLPDLAALDVRMIALYGQMNLLPPDWLSSLAAALAYGAALVALAVWALARKHLA